MTQSTPTMQNVETLSQDQEIELISSDGDSIDLALGTAAVDEWENDLDQLLLDTPRHPRHTTGVPRPEASHVEDHLKNVDIALSYLYSGPPGRHDGVEAFASKFNCSVEMIDVLVDKTRCDMLDVIIQEKHLENLDDQKFQILCWFQY